MWKKNFKRHSNKSSVFIFVFFRLISCHVWVCVRGCWSLSTIYHSWMYRYLLHMIHLCIISYLHYTTRCAESKTMLKKMTEFFLHVRDLLYTVTSSQTFLVSDLTLLTFHSRYLYLDDLLFLSILNVLTLSVFPGYPAEAIKAIKAVL